MDINPRPKIDVTKKLPRLYLVPNIVTKSNLTSPPSGELESGTQLRLTQESTHSFPSCWRLLPWLRSMNEFKEDNCLRKTESLRVTVIWWGYKTDPKFCEIKEHYGALFCPPFTRQEWSNEDFVSFPKSGRFYRERRIHQARIHLRFYKQILSLIYYIFTDSYL